MDIGAFVNPHSREFEFVIATVNLQQNQTEESLTNCQQKRDNNYPIYFEGQFNGKLELMSFVISRFFQNIKIPQTKKCIGRLLHQTMYSSNSNNSNLLL
jgi:hypothetical protein